jgi:Golgi SNAP receptor complex protein 2
LHYSYINGNLSQKSLFNSALKQSAAVRRDLDTFGEAPTARPAALQG